MKERGRKILETCLREKSKNPIDIFNNIAQMDFIRIHGPEHHVLDALSSAEHLMIIGNWKTPPENQTGSLRLSLKRLKTRY